MPDLPLQASLAVCALLVFSAAGMAAPVTRSPGTEVPLTAVRLHDDFWAPKLRIYRERTIPHSWQYVQREIEDNEIAADGRALTAVPFYALANRGPSRQVVWLPQHGTTPARNWPDILYWPVDRAFEPR